MVNRIQKLRKGLKLKIDDEIYVLLRFAQGADRLRRAYAAHKQLMGATVKKPLVEEGEIFAPETVGADVFTVEEEAFTVEIIQRTYAWDAAKLVGIVEEGDILAFVEEAIKAMGPASAFVAAGKKGFDTNYKGKPVLLKMDDHFKVY